MRHFISINGPDASILRLTEVFGNLTINPMATLSDFTTMEVTLDKLLTDRSSSITHHKIGHLHMLPEISNLTLGSIHDQLLKVKGCMKEQDELIIMINGHGDIQDDAHRILLGITLNEQKTATSEYYHIQTSELLQTINKLSHLWCQTSTEYICQHPV
jgi:hypothetical protein